MEKYNLTPVELMFAINLYVLMENGAEVSSYTKIAYLTRYSEPGAKKLCKALKQKGIVEIISVIGRNGKTTIKFLVNPMTLINA